MTGIYKIESIIKPQRIYFGSAVDIKKRWNKHRYDLQRNVHHSIKLQRHYNKYGINDLKFSIIEECSVELLLNKEQYYLNNNVTYFNVCKFAGNCLGRIPWNKNKKMSQEFSEKMRIISYGNMNRKGKKHSLETINKIKKSLSGRSKLNDGEINEILIKYVPRKYTAKILSKEYGVHKDTILSVIRKHNT